MSTIEIDGVGYAEASALLGDANRWAAVHVSTLGHALAGTGAMAGDSSFAGDFAAAYDEGAVTVVAAMDDVVVALGGLCRLAYCSLENHADAERSSIASIVVVSPEPSLLGADLYASATTPPPSSLGGDASFAPDWANVILDHVEGFVWPDADVDRLRAAAAAWRTAASDLTDVCDLGGRAWTTLSEQRSPEIPQALQAIGDLRLDIMSVAAGCQGLAGACDEYADAVETQRELILDLVRDLIRDAVLIAAAGFVIGLVSGGGGNAVAAWINSGKLAAEVPKFRALIEALRVCGAGVATTLRSTSRGLVRVRDDLTRFINSRRIHMGERGAIGLGGGRPASFLRSHEGGPHGAHTLRKHVGKSDDYLRLRLAREPRRSVVSTFTDEATAERSIRRVLGDHADDIAKWLASDSTVAKPLRGVMPENIGRIMDRSSNVAVPANGVRVVLVKDSSMPDGYRILTAMVE